MKTWQLVLLYVVIFGGIYYAVYTYNKNKKPVVPAPTTPSQPQTRETVQISQEVVPVNQTYIYSVRDSATEPGKCVYLMIGMKDGVQVGTYEISKEQFTTAMGGWANVCKKFPNISCVKAECSVIKNA